MSNNKNDVVIIKLDRDRELRFGHKALKRLTASTGIDLENLMDGKIDFEQVEKIMFYGLEQDAKANGETLTIEQVEDLLDGVPIDYYLEKMSEAFEKSFAGIGGNEGNAVGKPQKNK